MKPLEFIEDMPVSTLGERIKAVRVKWQWSQEEIASFLRVDQASISYWERDKVKPSGSALMALSALLRTSTEALVVGTGFRIPDSPSRPAAVKFDQWPRSVSLPMGDPADVIVVDLGDGSFRGKPVSEAMISLMRGAKEGRRAWLVLD